MAITAAEAYEAIRAHHKALSDALSERAGAVSGAASNGLPHGTAVTALIAYLASDVLTHAAAEEETIYAVAAAQGSSLAAVVAEMITEHVSLSAATARLATQADAAAAAEEAQQIAALFAAHAARENDTLLPVLLADKSVDLAGLLEQMHRYGDTGRDGGPDAAHGASHADDAQAAAAQNEVVSLLLQAAAALARAGEADRACRIAAAAWAALVPARPDLATKVTAALHGLTRRVDAEGPDGTAASGAPTAVPDPVLAGPDLDVHDLPPAQRHARILDAYHTLLPGRGFVLVNDHDPKPLRYQLEAEHAGQFTWDYLEAGPVTWQVRIGRPSVAAPDLDVRRVSHAQRHGLIFDTYRALRPGTGFVLVNDHDPKPLRYQFRAQYPGEHTWDYLEAGPKVWRVRIGRSAA